MVNLLEINIGSKYGGVEKHIEHIIKYINKNEFNLTIVCRKDSYFHKKILEVINDNKIKVIPIEIEFLSMFKVLRKLKKIIKINNIKIIHAHGIASSFIGNIIKNNKSILITTVHGYSNYDRIDKSYLIKFIFDKTESVICRNSNLCIAVSNDIKSYLLKKGIKEDKIKVIHHGIEYKEYNKDKKLKDNKIKIVSLGRLDKVKDYKTLIKAIKECVRNGYDLSCEIAGSGENEKELTDLIKELELNNNCKLVGFIKDVDKFLIEGDIYVQSSLIESFGISIIEAMQIGLPVIASNVGGIKDIISNDNDGMLFEVGNYKELSDKIIELIQDNKKKEYISCMARNKVNEDFIIDKKINELELEFTKLGGDKNENSSNTVI